MRQLGNACPTSFATTSGDTVNFTSDARPLPADRNGAPDVYERTFRVPTQHFAERRQKLPRYAQPHTVLVSATPSGSAGNGPSDQPTGNGSGDRIAYRPAATDIAQTAGNGVTDVPVADTETGAQTVASLTSMGDAVSDGPSSSPSISRTGGVLFETSADKNCSATSCS